MQISESIKSQIDSSLEHSQLQNDPSNPLLGGGNVLLGLPAKKYGVLMPVKLSRKSAELTSIQVERFYRQRILAGEISAGTKLPSNQVLSRQWSSSTAAVQRALATLAAEGLIERRQRRGTFVRDAAQQTFIGILVGPDLIYGASSFYRILSASIQAKLDSLYLKARVYDNLTFLPQSDIIHSHGNFQADRKSYPFKGYILIGTSNVAEDRIAEDIKPRAVFQDSTRDSDVILDYACFVEQSVTHLVKRGFRRITYFRGVHSSPLNQANFPVVKLHETAKRLSIPKPETWNMKISGNSTSYEQEVDKALNELIGGLDSASFKKKLPDVFLVQDDICARPLILNLLKRGIRIPEDVQICIQSVSENPVYYGVPVFHYQFSVAKITQQLCDVLHARLRNLEPEELPHWIRGEFLDPS